MKDLTRHSDGSCSLFISILLQLGRPRILLTDLKFLDASLPGILHDQKHTTSLGSWRCGGVFFPVRRGPRTEELS